MTEESTGAVSPPGEAALRPRRLASWRKKHAADVTIALCRLEWRERPDGLLVLGWGGSGDCWGGSGDSFAEPFADREEIRHWVYHNRWALHSEMSRRRGLIGGFTRGNLDVRVGATGVFYIPGGGADYSPAGRYRVTGHWIHPWSRWSRSRSLQLEIQLVAVPGLGGRRYTGRLGSETQWAQARPTAAQARKDALDAAADGVSLPAFYARIRRRIDEYVSRDQGAQQGEEAAR